MIFDLNIVLNNFVNQFPIVIYIITAFLSLIFFWIFAYNKTQLENNPVFLKQFAFLILITFLSLYIVFMNFENIDKNKDIALYIFTSIGSILSIFVISKFLSKSNIFKSKNKLKVLANRVVMHEATKKINKEKIRNDSREDPIILKDLLESDFIEKMKKAKLIKKEIKQKIEEDFDFGVSTINNLGLQIDFKIHENKKIKTEAIKNRLKNKVITKEKYIKNDLYLSIIEAIKKGYANKNFVKEVIEIDKKYNNIKFPISRYRLEMNIMKDYELSSKQYTVPLTNLTLLAKDEFHYEFIGGLQCLTTTGIQSVGYSYFLIYEEYKELLEKKKRKNNIERIKKDVETKKDTLSLEDEMKKDGLDTEQMKEIEKILKEKGGK